MSEFNEQEIIEKLKKYEKYQAFMVALSREDLMKMESILRSIHTERAHIQRIKDMMLAGDLLPFTEE